VRPAPGQHTRLGSIAGELCRRGGGIRSGIGWFAVRAVPAATARLCFVDREVRDSDDVQYICLDGDLSQWLVRPGPIEIPPLTARTGDVPRIVDEYVHDATVELAPAPRRLALTERDRQWLVEHAATMSLSEIEKAALRLVALRSSTHLSNAAARLGMAPVSLSRWAARRELPAFPDTARAA
jgi:hypothetical protein